MQGWKGIVGNAASAGLVGWGLAKVLIPGADTSYLLNGSVMNVAKGYGLVIAGSQVISDLIGDYVLPAAVQNQTLDMLLKNAGKPLLTGGVVVGMYYILNPSEVRANGLMAFATGAGASIGGTYLNDNFLRPMWGY